MTKEHRGYVGASKVVIAMEGEGSTHGYAGVIGCLQAETIAREENPLSTTGEG
jgi:hypothetical protein